MPTDVGPMRWGVWRRFRLSEKLLGGRSIHFNCESMTLRFLLFFAAFFSFVAVLSSLDGAIQAKKFARGCNMIARGGPRPDWGEL